MKNLNLVIDKSDLELPPNDKETSATELSARVIMNVVMTYSRQFNGLTKEERNFVYELDDTFETAKKENKETIELNDKVVGFLRKCFRETKLNPSSIMRKVEKNVDEIKER